MRTDHMARTAVKYQAVADALRTRITSGELPPASPLPSETELMRDHGISRPTARAAIAALRAEGLITVLHGKGAFVRADRARAAYTFHRSATGPSGTFADAPQTDWQTTDASTYRTATTADLALAFGLPEGAPVFGHDRLLTGPAGRRIAHQLYLPFAVVADTPALE